MTSFPGRPWAWYLAATLAASGVYILLPAYSPASTAIHLAVNASVIGALAWGIRRYRPDPRAPWLVLLAGYGLLLVANAARYGTAEPVTPLAGDAVSGGLYLVAYLATAIGLVLLARARGALRDVRSLSDATIAVIGVSVLWFEFLISPVLERPGITPSERIVAITYPVPDLVFLMLLLWIAFSKGSRGAALPLLIGGIVAQAAADGLLGISDVGLVSTGGIEGPLWLLSLALVGAAALHPSLPLIGTRSDRPSWLPAGQRVYLLALVSLLVPLSLLRESIRVDSGGGVAFSVAMAGLVLLVYGRLRGLTVDIETHTRTQAELRASEDRYRTLAADLDRQVTARTAELAERERQLREANIYLENLLASVPVVLFRGRGRDFAVEYVSPSVERVLGFTPQEVLDTPGFWVEHLPPIEHEPGVAAAREALEQGEPTFAFEHPMITSDGRERWMYSVVHNEIGVDGVPRFTGISVDITARKVAEAELAAAKEEADRASRAKTEFLSRMSHELRTPLNAVMGFGQLLELSPLSGDDRDSIQQILKSGRSLLAMIDGILEFTRVEAGKLTLSIEPVSLGELLAESLDLVRPFAEERGVTIVNELAGRTPRVVLADRLRLGQALLGLLDNAIRYNRSGGSVTISATDGAPGRLLLEIADTGVGIDPERIARLFEPFVATGSEGLWSRGIGLGLAFAKRLIEAMAGSISVRSALGEGSAFTLDLPLASAAEAAAMAGVPASDATAAGRRTRTILYIEDNFANLELVERVLQMRPTVRLMAATQGRLGMELAREHHPDLVLLDLHLPDVGPDETMRGLRDDPRTAGIPVVILSSEGSPARAREMTALGARAYLTKPLDLAVFLRVVDEVLAGGEEPA